MGVQQDSDYASTKGADAPSTILTTSITNSDTTHAPDGNAVFDALALKASSTEPIAAAHIIDSSDAHAASAITNTPAGGIAATTVQAAINELDTEKQAALTLPLAVNQGGTASTTDAAARSAFKVGFVTVADEATMLLLTGYPVGIEVSRTDNGYRYVLNNAASPSSASSWQAIPKVYRALLTQAGTDAPTTVILQNTVGSIVWTRSGAGNYVGTLAGAFLAVSTALLMGSPVVLSDYALYQFYRVSDNVVSIVTYSSDGGVVAPSDDMLSNTTVEILAYP